MSTYHVRPHMSAQASIMAAALAAINIAPFPITDHLHAPKGYRTINRLNRSRRWAYARTYAEAREISPSTEPVR